MKEKIYSVQLQDELQNTKDELFFEQEVEALENLEDFQIALELVKNLDVTLYDYDLVYGYYEKNIQEAEYCEDITIIPLTFTEISRIKIS